LCNYLHSPPKNSDGVENAMGKTCDQFKIKIRITRKLYHRQNDLSTTTKKILSS
jgi:hypothetical protein